MEVELSEDAIDRIRLSPVLADLIERVACSFHRQGQDVQSLAGGGDGGGPRRDTGTDVAELAQLLHHGVDLLGVHPSCVENGFGIIEEHDHLRRG